MIFFLTVCDDEEILVGDACVYNSKSTGDIQTKPECEPYKNSYSEHPFILPDAAAVYSKAAYLLQTKVSAYMFIWFLYIIFFETHDD